MFAPAGTVLLLVLAAVLAGLSCWRSGQRFAWPNFGLVSVLAVLLVWSAVTAIWAFNPPGSLFLSIRLVALFAAGFLLYACAATLTDVQRNAVGRWLTIGFLLGLVILAEEIVFGYPLMALLKGPGAVSISATLNRGATALAMLSWPVAAYLWQRLPRRQTIALLVLTGGIIGASESQAAGLAMVAGAITVLIALAHRQAGRALLMVTSAALFAGAPFVAGWFYELGWQHAAWLPDTARQRVDIWYTAADLIAQKPLFGWGFDASRAVSQGYTHVESGVGLIPLHPHNAPLQVILELGAVGGVIAVALLWILAARLDRFPAPSRLFGQASFAATLAVACTAYGIWQNQWLATIFSTALLIYATRSTAAVEMPQQDGHHGHGS